MIGNGFIQDLRFLYRHFGLQEAWKQRVIPTIKAKILGKDYYKEYNAAVVAFLRKDLKDIVERYKEIFATSSAIPVLRKDAPIWVCWWQGETQMPPIIRKCYQILRKQANGHVVHLVTESNCRDIVKIPEHVYEHLKEGRITITHFTDILRTALLSQHGGLWLDATYFVCHPIEIEESVWYTLKQSKRKTSLASKFRWTGSLMGGDLGFPFFGFLFDCLVYYWERHKGLINYFFLDYLIVLAYEEFPQFKVICDNNPLRTPDLHDLKKLFFEPYDADRWKQITACNEFLALSWKLPFPSLTSDGKQTYFGHFMNMQILEEINESTSTETSSEDFNGSLSVE